MPQIFAYHLSKLAHQIRPSLQVTVP